MCQAQDTIIVSNSEDIMNTVNASLDSSITSTTSSAMSSSSTSDRKRSQRSVSFDTVEVRCYPMILDESRDNTGLTIGWESFEEEHYRIVDEESEDICQEQQQGQGSSSSSKRSVLEPLNYKERIFILLRAGYTPTHLRQSMRQI